MLFVLGLLAVAAITATAVATGEDDSAGMAGRMGMTAAAQPGSPTAAQPGSSTAAQPDPEGRRVFLRDCAWCHGEQGQGSGLAPSLNDVGEASAHFQLTTGRMPLASADDEVEPGPPAYSPETIEALVSYVGTLGEGRPVPEPAPGDIKRGRTLFLYNCAPCHSSSGTGMILPEGEFAPELFDSTPVQTAEAIRLGPGTMPAFPESHLDKQHMEDLVSYVQELGDKQVVGGHPLDQIGPIAEGTVAWLVAMPVLVLVIRLLGKRAK